MLKKLTFKLISPVYDTLISGIESEREKALGLLQFNAGEKALIVGIGTGADIPYLPKDIEIEGIDCAREMLAKAKIKAERLGTKNVNLKLMDAECLQYPDNYFDKVTLFLILSVADNPQKALSEAVRVVKPGGEILVFDKFLKYGKSPGILRRGINFILSNFGTDINRRFEDIIEDKPITVEKSVSSILDGFFMIYLCRKKGD